ncbi:YybH family protein [Candidatus Reidiella endopervernicosa]|uniref:Nuclear transport factor 2 family protein n=1 Tax=Candidatus Reidiella endopervernicosa TaxID=2738883 RepID=A0A6N0HVR6_9GAMM|nr:nuclear transport factor 2 family protein [Candidatus Reidiella endopervernicosa]QKQ26448.1 nuclear transport factor 2 family protein [Candidatus Reidiella endopervernicosa]
MSAVEGFYSALNLTFEGDMEPMKAVWSHADDITYMGPYGGFQVGWKQVLEVWEEHTAMKIGGKVEHADMRVTLGEDIALTQNYEIGENNPVEGEPEKVSIRATNVFRKEEGSGK